MLISVTNSRDGRPQRHNVVPVLVIGARKDARSAAASSERARLFDVLQSETRQGPCLDALFHQHLAGDDLATEERWPDLFARVEELAAHSMVCFQLFVTGNTLGFLSLLATEPGAFCDESERVVLLFATRAAIALADAQELQDVKQGLVNLDVLGQAKGILMERFKITAEEAFRLLAKASQQTTASSTSSPPTWPTPAPLTADPHGRICAAGQAHRLRSRGRTRCASPGEVLQQSSNRG